MKLIVPPRKCFCHYLGIVRTLMNKTKSNVFKKDFWYFSKFTPEMISFILGYILGCGLCMWKVLWTKVIQFRSCASHNFRSNLEYVMLYFLSEIITFLKRHWLIRHFSTNVKIRAIPPTNSFHIYYTHILIQFRHGVIKV